MAIYDNRHVIIQNEDSSPKCAKVRIEIENYVGKYLYVNRKQIIKIYGELNAEDKKCPFCKRII